MFHGLAFVIIDGWWCLPGGWWCPRGGWWWLVSSWWLVVSSWCPGVLAGCHRWLVVAPWCWWCSSVAGGGSLVLVVLLGGWWWLPGNLARIFTAGHAGGGTQRSSVRRRSRFNGSISGFFLIGYYSIFQLFKFSYRMPYAKVFTGENLIKTLFSINYRGYFIIQAAHTTINYSYFLHKTDRKHMENQ